MEEAGKRIEEAGKNDGKGWKKGWKKLIKKSERKRQENCQIKKEAEN
jgi:hypothetical protein